MAFAIRKIPLTIALMLGCSALSLPAHAGWFDSDSKPAESKAKPDDKAAAVQPATSLEDSIRQAQMLRLAGQYPEAVKHLSQLMMLASDDGRVISEYGKTLAAMGRPADAVNFLTRAQQLQPGDWTIYSALGVAYDQIGDQKSAQQAYEHALAIKPEEPSVLNNYALSRMLAKDPDMARKLAARAESAGGNSDAKIARNITLIRSLAAEAPAPAPVAVQTPPAQIPVAHNQAPAPLAASNSAPHAPASASANAPSAPQIAHNVAPSADAHDNRVVMQRVPVDPLAGPVQPAKTANAAGVATNAPRPLQPALQSKTVAVQAEPAKVDTLAKDVPAKPVIANIVKADVDPAAKTAAGKPPALSTAPVVKADAGKPVPATASKTPVPAPVTVAETKPAPAKTAEAAKPVATPSTTQVVKAAEANKPVAVTVSKPVSTTVNVAETKPAAAKTAEAAKPAATPSIAPVVKSADAKPVVPVTASKTPAPTPVKTAETKPVPAKTAEADKPAAAVTLKLTPPPVKAADAGKPVPAPKVLPPVPVKATAKDAIPGLRMSANAY